MTSLRPPRILRPSSALDLHFVHPDAFQPASPAILRSRKCRSFSNSCCLRARGWQSASFVLITTTIVTSNGLFSVALPRMQGTSGWIFSGCKGSAVWTPPWALGPPGCSLWAWERWTKAGSWRAKDCLHFAPSRTLNFTHSVKVPQMGDKRKEKKRK